MPIFAIVWVLIATGVTSARTQTPGVVPPIFAGVVPSAAPRTRRLGTSSDYTRRDWGSGDR